MKLFISKVFKNYFLMTITLTLTEIIFRLVSDYAIWDWAFLRIFVGINIVSLLLGTLFSFCGRVAGNILTFIISSISSEYR